MNTSTDPLVPRNFSGKCDITWHLSSNSSKNGSTQERKFYHAAGTCIRGGNMTNSGECENQTPAVSIIVF